MSSTLNPGLVFIHTSPSHIATFDRLRDELAPARAIGHVVREDLLCAVRKAGQVTMAVEIKLGEVLHKIAAAGAMRIVCTCSTLGGVAERSQIEGAKILRIDRPMVCEAVAIGGRIAVCAALGETLGPTLSLVDEEMVRRGRSADVTTHVFDGVWEDFQEGRQRDYYAGISARLRDVAREADVIVLAQASMAPAAELCADLAVPILSSPRTGFVAALT